MPKTGLKGPKMGANQGIFKHPFSTGRCRVHDWAGVVNNFSCGVLPSNFQKQSTDRKYLDRFIGNEFEKTGGRMLQIALLRGTIRKIEVFEHFFGQPPLSSQLSWGKYFFSGRDFDLSCPKQVWDQKYLNHSSHSSSDKSHSQIVKIQRCHSTGILTYFRPAASLATNDTGQWFLFSFWAFASNFQKQLSDQKYLNRSSHSSLDKSHGQIVKI